MKTILRTLSPFLVPYKRRKHFSVYTSVHASSRWRLPATSETKEARSVPMKSVQGLTMDAERDPKLKTEGSVVVLFKNDLRIEDHPGPQMASKTRSPVIPLYCLDPNLVRNLEETPGGIELLWGALKHLKDSLRAAGSDLIIRVGDYVKTVVSVLEELNCTMLITEIEAESKWSNQIQKLKTEAPFLQVCEWESDLYEIHSYSDNYHLMDGRRTVQTPLQRVKTLNPIPDHFMIDQMMDVDEFSALFSHDKTNGVVLNGDRKDPFQGRKLSLWKEFSQALFEDKEGPNRYIKEYLKLGNNNNNGLLVVKLKEIIQHAEDARFPGLSFTALFALPLSLGVISPRQIYSAIYQQKEDQNWLKSVFPDPYTKAVEQTCLSFDFHKAIAKQVLVNGCKSVPGNSEMKFWRWQGMLLEYSIARPTASSNGVTVVLVHGFGASSYHWRRNVDALTSSGYTVFSPTLPGYGRSQKCYLKYSDIVWQEFLTSFIKDIAQEPVVLVGNSIGAFVAIQTAGLHPSLVKALVLINPAGRLDFEYVPGPRTPIIPWSFPSFLTDALSKALLFYLSKTAKSTLRSLYPVNVHRADSAFLEDILRSSKDPNAISVLKSVFFLQKPVPLNYYLTEMYRGEVLLLQGALDPLNPAVERAELLRDLRPGVTVEIVQAGHCPHDEIPELINSRLISFLDDAL